MNPAPCPLQLLIDNICNLKKKNACMQNIAEKLKLIFLMHFPNIFHLVSYNLLSQAMTKMISSLQQEVSPTVAAIEGSCQANSVKVKMAEKDHLFRPCALALLSYAVNWCCTFKNVLLFRRLINAQSVHCMTSWQNNSVMYTSTTRRI